MFQELRPHLVELRKRLGLSVLSVFVAFCIAFIFHNPILTWITQPLNDALTQVGKIVESRNAEEWKIQTDEKNVTVVLTASNVAQQLEEKLSQAAKLTQDKLSTLLQEAADAAKK